MDVVIQALDYLESRNGIEFNYVLLLQPTSPFRLVEDIDSAIRLALEGNADSVIGVSEALSHPYLTMRIKDSDGTVENFMQKPEGYPRRQDLPPAYVVNGAIYLTRREVLIKEKTFFPDHTLGFVMPQERSMDIDTLWDFHLAEMIMESPCDTEMP